MTDAEESERKGVFDGYFCHHSAWLVSKSVSLMLKWVVEPGSFVLVILLAARLIGWYVGANSRTTQSWGTEAEVGPKNWPYFLRRGR